jgi:amidohydrolase
MSSLAAAIRPAVTAETDSLIGLSREIHRHPELGFQEVRAHALLTDYLEESGFEVTRSAYGLDTAFRAEVSTGEGPTVAFICEYDALPELGHGCGHNIIAAAGAGAGVLAKTLLEAGHQGRVVVLGTPAEEGGGGKVMMIERGAFEDVDVAMMVHPAGRDLTEMTTVAIQRARVDYQGHAAHAAAAPHLGRNALDAAVLGYVNVAALRQHLAPHERVHGIITEGGTRPNIVPERTQAEWYMRSPSMDGLQTLVKRVTACLDAGAAAAGCEWTQEPIGRVYNDLVTDGRLLDLYVESAAEVGRSVEFPTDRTRIVGSTDMGNVSHAVPSIHPMIRCSPSDVPLHTRLFAEHAGGPDGDRAVLDGAAALALTAGRLLEAPRLVVSPRPEHV